MESRGSFPADDVKGENYIGGPVEIGNSVWLHVFVCVLVFIYRPLYLWMWYKGSVKGVPNVMLVVAMTDCTLSQLFRDWESK